MTERDLQRECEAVLRLLQAAGVILRWYHRPDSPRRIRPEQRGLPDLLIGVRRDLVLGVELKTAKGKTSAEQDDWLACFGDRGAVCRSVEDLYMFLGRHGVIQ